MVPVDLVENARAGLLELHAESAKFVQAHGPLAVEGSPASRDVAGYARAESVHTVYGQALTLIEIAADQLTAFTKTISAPYETIAPWTCIRSLLEAAALAAWLAEPGVDVGCRVQRSFAFRYEGLIQQVKFARATGDLDPQLALDRIDAVTGVAAGLGILPVRDKKGRQIGIGIVMPSVTTVIAAVLDMEEIYRLLSAVAHGHFWATNQAGFTVADEAHTTEEGARLTPMTKAVNAKGVAYLAAAGAAAFARAAWYHSLYAGWPAQELAGVLRSACDRVGVHDERLSWLVVPS
jgi:hypothetical protein